MKRVHGLTLVEVAIAILVVALLFAVGIPAYHSRLTRQVVAEAIELATPAKETIQEYASIHGRLPTTQEVALPFVTSKYVTTTTWAGDRATGTVTVSTQSGPGTEHGDLDGKAVVLAASYHAAKRTVVWVCGGTPATTIADPYLPDECKKR